MLFFIDFAIKIELFAKYSQNTLNFLGPNDNIYYIKVINGYNQLENLRTRRTTMLTKREILDILVKEVKKAKENYTALNKKSEYYIDRFHSDIPLEYAEAYFDSYEKVQNEMLDLSVRIIELRNSINRLHGFKPVKYT